MANIPTIPGTSQVESPELGVKIDPRSRLMAIGQAAETIGEGLSVISDYEQRKQKAEEVAGFNQTSIVLNKATSDYQHGLATMDDKQIVPKWEEIATKTKDEVMKNTAGWTPAAKNKLSQTLDTWTSDSTIQFQVASDHLGSQRRKATAVAASQEFLQTGDKEMLPNAMNALKAAKDAGDMTEAEYNQHVSGLTRGLETNQIMNGIASDPQATLRDMKAGEFKNVPAKLLLQLQTKAGIAVTNRQNGTRDDILKRHDAGEVIDEDEIATKESAGELSPQAAKTVRQSISQKDLKEAKDNHALLMMRADDIDWTQEKNPQKKAQEIMDDGAGLPLPLRKSLFEHVQSKEKAALKAGVAAEKPVQKAVFDRMKEDREENGLTIPMTSEVVPGTTRFFRPNDADTVKFEHVAGGLKTLRDVTKLPDATIEQKFGKGMTRQKLFQAEELHYAQQLGKMRDWFKANPDASDEEAEKYRLGLEKPYVMAGVSKTLLKGHPTAVTSQDEFEALPSGAPFIYNGRIGTKN